MKKRRLIHIIAIALIPGYWIVAIIIYLYYKIKHKPVKLRKVEKKIKEKVRKELHVN